MRLSFQFILLLLSFLFISDASAFTLMGERTALFEKRHYQSRTGFAAMDYYLLKPANYDPQKSYPLVLTLHGASGHSWGAYVLSLPEMQNRYPAFVLVPHAEVNNWTSPQFFDLRPKPSTHVVNIIDQLKKELSIDPHRIYVTGYSMGGYGTSNIVAQYPLYFAGAAPLCGGGDLSKVRRMIGTPFWVFHGLLDDIIFVDESRKLVQAMRNTGGHPFYTEYPRVSHGIWNDVYIDNKFWDWLFSLKRQW